MGGGGAGKVNKKKGVIVFKLQESGKKECSFPSFSMQAFDT